MVYKRGETWWYEFVFNGERIRESTKQGNKRVAEQIEAARRTGLAKGEAGIVRREKAPTLTQFIPRFESANRHPLRGEAGDDRLLPGKGSPSAF